MDSCNLGNQPKKLCIRNTNTGNTFNFKAYKMTFIYEYKANNKSFIYCNNDVRGAEAAAPYKYIEVSMQHL